MRPRMIKFGLGSLYNGLGWIFKMVVEMSMRYVLFCKRVR
jgi:hypothetical protein